jgi:hypothetical protein
MLSDRIQLSSWLAGLALAMTGCTTPDSDAVDGKSSSPSADDLVMVEPAPDLGTPGKPLAVTSRGFGAGYARFELDHAVDDATIDLGSTQIYALRPGENGQVREVDLTGEVHLADAGRTLWVQLAEAPRPGSSYHARTALADGRSVELGGIFIGSAPAGDRPRDTLFVAPRLLAFDEWSDIPLVFGEMTPRHNEGNVPRDIGMITMHYNTPIDCDNPIRGEAAFKIWSDNPALARSQVIFDQMSPWTPDNPGIICDPVRNDISLRLPGLLVGGSRIFVETRARGLDGTELAVNSWFYTANPGLAIWVTSVENQISHCDTSNPFSDSEDCDVYVVSRTKPKSRSEFQINLKLPQSGGYWDDWDRGGRVDFAWPNPPVLYMDGTALDSYEPLLIELQAFDADGGDGVNRVLSALGGVGKIAAIWWPPAGPIGEGLSVISQALPHDDDDPLGAGVLYFSKDTSWGAKYGWQTLRVPGRAFGNQIVLNTFFQEFPKSWYFEIIE